ncbi:uncharacterized protein LOC128323262, partial [Hemicordylus capensis]|uniref:uncharacterized protein LOC128323262 n=1 Tax=Hemicordylus capensis TaxID=884348 RepID=UPI00230473B9
PARRPRPRLDGSSSARGTRSARLNVIQSPSGLPAAVCAPPGPPSGTCRRCGRGTEEEVAAAASRSRQGCLGHSDATRAADRLLCSFSLYTHPCTIALCACLAASVVAGSVLRRSLPLPFRGSRSSPWAEAGPASPSVPPARGALLLRQRKHSEGGRSPTPHRPPFHPRAQAVAGGRKATGCAHSTPAICRAPLPSPLPPASLPFAARGTLRLVPATQGKGPTHRHAALPRTPTSIAGPGFSLALSSLLRIPCSLYFFIRLQVSLLLITITWIHILIST